MCINIRILDDSVADKPSLCCCGQNVKPVRKGVPSYLDIVFPTANEPAVLGSPDAESPDSSITRSDNSDTTNDIFSRPPVSESPDEIPWKLRIEGGFNAQILYR